MFSKYNFQQMVNVGKECMEFSYYSCNLTSKLFQNEKLKKKRKNII